jgi:lipase chaperone LimK
LIFAGEWRSLRLKPRCMRFVFIFLLFTAGACRETTGLSKYEKIAAAYCECTAKLAEMSAHVASEAADTTASVSFQQNLLQLQEEYNNARECAAAINQQYGKLPFEELTKVEKVLSQKCTNAESQGHWLTELLGE